MSDPDSGQFTGGRPVAWALDLGRVRDHLLVSVAVLAAAPRPLWVWFVIVQPAVALAVVPWIGTAGIALFAAAAIVPLALAWGAVLRQRGTRFAVSPTRATLQVRDASTQPSKNGREDLTLALGTVERIVAVPLGRHVAVRLRFEGEYGAPVPRILVVPADRWQAFAASLDRAGVPIPGDGTGVWRPPLGTIAAVVVGALVSAAGLVAAVVVLFGWILETG